MKTSAMICGLAAVLLAATATQASDGAIDQSTLAAMGLADATIVTDQQASEVRGNGFAPIAIAAGGSFAYVGGPWANAGSVNGYFSIGNNFAGGVNGSTAGGTFTKTKTKYVLGFPVLSVTKTKSVSVYAGGFSAAAAF